MRVWKTLARRTLLECGKFLTVENHTVELPDGQIISEWPWVITPDFVNIVAVTETEQFVSLRQIKYAAGEVGWGIAGGYIEPDEPPLVAAQRELREETGYEAAEWVSLGHYPVDGNRGAGTAYPFLALNARQITTPDADDLEEQELYLLDRTQVERFLAEGEFKVMPWAMTVALALLWLDGKVRPASITGSAPRS
jgi:ADP-ribose pyrophosphatase